MVISQELETSGLRLQFIGRSFPCPSCYSPNCMYGTGGRDEGGWRRGKGSEEGGSIRDDASWRREAAGRSDGAWRRSKTGDEGVNISKEEMGRRFDLGSERDELSSGHHSEQVSIEGSFAFRCHRI